MDTMLGAFSANPGNCPKDFVMLNSSAQSHPTLPGPNVSRGRKRSVYPVDGILHTRDLCDLGLGSAWCHTSVGQKAGGRNEET